MNWANQNMAALESQSKDAQKVASTVGVETAESKDKEKDKGNDKDKDKEKEKEKDKAKPTSNSPTVQTY
jgi:hypothetical protein